MWAKVHEVIFVSFICCCFFCPDDGRLYLLFFKTLSFSYWLILWFAFSDGRVDAGFVILFQMCYFLE